MKTMDVYKCGHCDEIFEKLFEGSACEEEGCACEDMEMLDAQTADWKNEKHVPVVEKVEGGIRVYVGSTLHPMTDEHWITLIEVKKGDMVMRKHLHPGDKPEAVFPIDDTDVVAREYCNIHGLWANQ